MSKSNKYGYVGVDIPSQNFGSNKGIFNPAEINELVADNKWTQYGQLELIETQTVSSASTVEFQSLPLYNVYFAVWNDIHTNTDGKVFRIRTMTGTSDNITSYQKAIQRGRSDGSFTELKTTSATAFDVDDGIGNATNELTNGYVYIYNLQDSSKYTFFTQHNSCIGTGGGLKMNFGSGVYAVAEANDGLLFRFEGSTTTTTGSVSLYGIRYS